MQEVEKGKKNNTNYFSFKDTVWDVLMKYLASPHRKTHLMSLADELGSILGTLSREDDGAIENGS